MKPAVRLSTAELRENLGELATDLIESAVQRDVQSVDFPIDTLDQLVERVDVGTLLAHLTLDLGLGHCGNHSGHRAGQHRYALCSTERSKNGQTGESRRRASFDDDVVAGHRYGAAS